MRLWSLHPQQLDRVGLIACWRESLLAQKVLLGETRGYRHHPQLIRFRALPDPLVGISTYLAGLADEADRRGFRFNRQLILRETDRELRVPVTTGQLEYEWEWLQTKLRARAPELADDGRPQAHPLFAVIPGPVAAWEVVPSGGRE